MPSFKPVIITATAPTREEAEKIGLLLLEQGLAACVQYENIASHYVWEGKVCRDEEIRMVIKTARCRYRAVEKLILANHSYDCPQIIMQAVAGGSRAYLGWLRKQVGC